MWKKSLWLSFGLVMLLGLVGSIFPAYTQAQQTGTNQTLPDGANFIFVNYIGQEVHLDLDDVSYVVQGTATAPEGGRLTLTLAPGEHKFAANVPGVPLGTAAEFTIPVGGYVAKAAVIDQTPPKVENDILIEKPRDFVKVFDFDPFEMPAEEPAIIETWQPAPPVPGQGSLVWMNYGGIDELTIDLNGQLYKAPPQSGETPGRLQIDVAPGLYRYTASVPNGSLNGELTVAAGQIIGLSIYAEREPLDYDVGDDFSFIAKVNLTLSQENLTAQPAVGPETDMTPVDTAVTEETPASPTATEAVSPETAAPAQMDGLLIKNFTWDTITFTINNEAYPVPVNTETVLNLPPGQYNYTASLPFVARTGTVDLAAEQSIELSIAINITGDVLSIYQN